MLLSIFIEDERLCNLTIPHSFSFLIGFYGKCRETPCLNYNLESPKSLEIFDSVYEVNQQSNNTIFIL